MLLEINQKEAALLVELLQKVDGMVQYSDVQNEISELLDCFVGFIPSKSFERS